MEHQRLRDLSKKIVEQSKAETAQVAAERDAAVEELEQLRKQLEQRRLAAAPPLAPPSPKANVAKPAPSAKSAASAKPKIGGPLRVPSGTAEGQENGSSNAAEA